MLFRSVYLHALPEVLLERTRYDSSRPLLKTDDPLKKLRELYMVREKYSSNPARDAAREADIQELEQMWQEKTDDLVKQGLPISDDLAAFKWMIEELRVSLFAQELKTPYPVSVKRLLKEWGILNKM